MNSDDADDWDTHWDQYADSAEQNPAQRWRRSLILERLGPTAGDRLLDIGSGQGDLARDLLVSVPGVEIAGLELSASGVEVASEKVPSAQFHRVNLLSEHPVVEQLRDWATHVVCSEVLEHVDDPTRLLRAGLRHAAPGARVVVTVPAGPRTAFDRHIGHRQHFDRAGLADIMQSSGLVDIQVEAAGMPFFNLYRLVVFARGDRLIEEMSSGGSGTESRLGKLVLRFFDLTLPITRRRGRFGWQLVAVASVPLHRREDNER